MNYPSARKEKGRGGKEREEGERRQVPIESQKLNSFKLCSGGKEREGKGGGKRRKEREIVLSH